MAKLAGNDSERHSTCSRRQTKNIIVIVNLTSRDTDTVSKTKI